MQLEKEGGRVRVNKAGIALVALSDKYNRVGVERNMRKGVIMH